MIFFLGSTALHIAIKYGNMDIVEVLLYNSANIHIRDRDGNNALHVSYNNLHSNLNLPIII